MLMMITGIGHFNELKIAIKSAKSKYRMPK